MKKLLTIGSAAVATVSSLAFPLVAFAAPGDLDPCKADPDAAWCALGKPQNFGVALGNIINFIFVIAVILALAFLIYGGIRWLVSGGDKEGVEKARNTIVAAIVGLIIVFLAYVILNLVLTFLTGSGIAALEIPNIKTGST